MKISPYLFYDWASYNAALDVFNASNNTLHSEIYFLKHSDGKIINKKWVVLQPFESKMILFSDFLTKLKPVDRTGRFKIVVKCEDDIKLSVFHFTYDGKIINNNIYELDDSVFLEYKITEAVGSPVIWEKESAWHHTAGMTNFYNKPEIIEGIKEIAYRVDSMFPNRKDKRLGVMDASSFDSTQPYNHPVGAHLRGEELDLNYYTFDNNITQFTDNSLFTDIWTGNNLNEKFDIERNYYLFKLMTEYFPFARIIVDTRILQKLKTLSYFDIAGSRIFGDNSTALGHNHHAHVRPESIKIK